MLRQKIKYYSEVFIVYHLHEERKLGKTEGTYLDIRYRTEFSIAVNLRVFHFICNNFLSLKNATFTSYSDLIHNVELI